METMWIGDMDGQAAADALVANHAGLVEAEATELALAAHWADLHSFDPDDAPSDLPAGGRVLPGSERSRRYGGHGTPDVGEFAAAELAVLLGRGPLAGSALIADALDVRHRHPRLWQAVCAGRVRVWQAREVAKRTRTAGLTRDQAAWVDAHTTPYLPSLPWTRFCDLLDAKVIEVDPDAAQARAEAAALDRFVATGQSNEHGLKTLIAKAEAGQVIYLVAVIDRIGEILLLEGDTRPVGVRRSEALALLATPTRVLALLERWADTSTTSDSPDSPAGPDATSDHPDEPDEPDEPDTATAGWPACGGGTGDPVPFTRPASADLDPAKLLPKAVLYLHCSRESFDATLAGAHTGVARMEGVGPITLPQAITFLGHSNVTVKEVIDLDADHPVDGYEVPTKMREQLRLRSPAQVFPHTGLAHPGTDADHTIAYLPPNRGGPPGQTRIANLGHLARHPHRVKTHAKGWSHRQPEPGVHLWRTPHGYRYRVDHTGTHPLGKNPTTHPESPLERAFADLIAGAAD